MDEHQELADEVAAQADAVAERAHELADELREDDEAVASDTDNDGYPDPELDFGAPGDHPEIVANTDTSKGGYGDGPVGP